MYRLTIAILLILPVLIGAAAPVVPTPGIPQSILYGIIGTGGTVIFAISVFFIKGVLKSLDGLTTAIDNLAEKNTSEHKFLEQRLNDVEKEYSASDVEIEKRCVERCNVASNKIAALEFKQSSNLCPVVTKSGN